MATQTAFTKLDPPCALTKAFFARLRRAWRREISTGQPFQVFAQLARGLLLSRGPSRIYEGIVRRAGFSNMRDRLSPQRGPCFLAGNVPPTFANSRTSQRS